MADKQAKELLLTKFNLCNVLLLIPKRGTINFPDNYDVTIGLNTEVVENFYNIN